MTQDLSSVVAGFAHEAFGSQAVFRAALQALSHPGRCTTVAHDAELPRHGHAAAAVLLLALLDADCTLWLSPSLRHSDAAQWLRFHTGCRLVDNVAQAGFVWVAAADVPPDLQSLRQGSDEAPEQSATCVLEVRSLSAGPGAGTEAEADVQCWTLSGPGIREQASLGVGGLRTDLVSAWVHNHASFPRGVDLFLATPEQIVGLPRTTRIHAIAEA